jgi:hypothetical protein
VGEPTHSWKYDKQGAASLVAHEERVLFLRTIPELRPQVITSLYHAAFVKFIAFVVHRFRKHLIDVPLPSDNSSNELFKCLWNIPEEEVQIATIGGWNALQRKKRTKDLVEQLRGWAQEQNLTADWCLDHAIEVLRVWFYDERQRWLDMRLQSPLSSIVIPGWLEAITNMEFKLAYSRYELQTEVLSSNSGDPPLFVFEWKGLRFEAAGWNYVREGKETWKKRVEREFDRFKDQCKVRGQTVPVGTLTTLRKKLATHVKIQDAAKQAAVKDHGLVKRSRNYAKHSQADHVKWLIMYQIPPCQKYGEIAELNRKSIETVRKYVATLAARIDLRLRDKSLHAGSPPGKRHRSPHRAMR